VKIRVPLLRELSMLAVGNAGMVRELFWVAPADFSLTRVTICAVLILGPTATWAWARARLPDPPASSRPGRGSRSPASRLPPDG